MCPADLQEAGACLLLVVVGVGVGGPGPRRPPGLRRGGLTRSPGLPLQHGQEQLGEEEKGTNKEKLRISLSRIECIGGKANRNLD